MWALGCAGTRHAAHSGVVAARGAESACTSGTQNQAMGLHTQCRLQDCLLQHLLCWVPFALASPGLTADAKRQAQDDEGELDENRASVPSLSEEKRQMTEPKSRLGSAAAPPRQCRER